MKYRILEIHPLDAFHDWPDLIGKVAELTIIGEWTENDTSPSGVCPAGYSYTEGDYHFHAVKLAPVDEQSEAIANLALSLSVAMSNTTDADMRTKLEAMNQILIGALKAARNDNAPIIAKG